MGLDAQIHCKADPDAEIFISTNEITAEDHYHSTRLPDGATHEICYSGRFYEEGYHSGDWPAICAILMELLANPKVSKVWYGHDCGGPVEITADDVLRISAHYMKRQGK
jgi:hypothetical protein